MSKRTNAKNRLKVEQVMARRNDGDKEIGSELLTEAEKVQMSVLLEKLADLQSQSEQVRRAISALIVSIVSARGLDPKRYGVNVGQGKVLPLDENEKGE